MNKYLEDKINSLIHETKAERITVKALFKGRFITLLEEEYILPNGKIIKRERIKKNNGKEAVIVVTKTIDDKYLLVVQNRIRGIVSVEFPSGYVEEGEDVITAANRELKEETGYSSDNITFLDRYYNSFGIDGSIINIVVAKDAIKVSDQSLGDSEYINYGLFTQEELKELIDNNYISGAGNRLAYFEMINGQEIKSRF